jgi:hypothetical protein
MKIRSLTLQRIVIASGMTMAIATAVVSQQSITIVEATGCSNDGANCKGSSGANPIVCSDLLGCVCVDELGISHGSCAE